MNLVNTMHEEVADKTDEELMDLNTEVLYNRGNIQNMTQILMTTDDPDLLIHT